MIRVAILVMDRVFDSSLAISLDVLHAADTIARAKGRAGLSIEPYSSGEGTGASTSSGLQVSGLRPLTELELPDVVLLVGCNVGDPQSLSQWLASPHVLRVQERLRRLAPRMSVVAGGHAASFLMAGADLLHGRVATTAWWLAPEFLRRFPGVTLDMRRRVVDDGKYLTSGAPLAQLDLVLHLVDRLYGPVVAQLVSSHLLADAHGSQNHLAGSGRFAGQHPDVSNAEKWILDNMGRAFTLGELAAAMHTTPRTLSRRFMDEMGTSPYDFIQRLRADRAHHLLRTTRQPLQHIAEQVGYQNAGALRRVFKRFDYPVPSAVRRAGGAHLAPSRSPDLP